VVAYALAGTIGTDLEHEPLGTDSDGNDVYLRDIWPSPEEVQQVIEASITPDLFDREYGTIWDGDEHWQRMDAPTGQLFAWDPDSTYVREPSFFQDLGPEPAPVEDVVDARALAVLGDSVTTDHISPAGSIPPDGPAGRYLISHGVERHDFNSFGSRRGNHEVMVRGTFANIRLRNLLVPGVEGGVTEHLPTGERLSIYDAAERYRESGTPLVVLAGKEYGSGSSRDWAAKGTVLLGVRAVIAASYERIHRSNLVGMGVIPFEFMLGLTGRERFTIRGCGSLAPRQVVEIQAVAEDGTETRFHALARIDSPVELEYLRHGGILQMVLRRMMAG
jgi:aconitate hydratase